MLYFFKDPYVYTRAPLVRRYLKPSGYYYIPSSLTFINSVLYPQQNEQRLFPYTTLTDWFL